MTDKNGPKSARERVELIQIQAQEMISETGQHSTIKITLEKI